MPQAYIVEAVRTAGGRRGGRLAGVHPVDLAAKSLDAIMERSGLEATTIDDVVMFDISGTSDEDVSAPVPLFVNPPQVAHLEGVHGVTGSQNGAPVSVALPKP